MIIKKTKFIQELQARCWLAVHGIEENKEKINVRIKNACLIKAQEKQMKKLK